MKKIKGLLFGIIALLGIGFSSSFYVDLTSINPVGGSVYNVLGNITWEYLRFYNNGTRIEPIQSGAYNTILTGFSSTNDNQFYNKQSSVSNFYVGSGNLFLYFTDGTNFGFGNSYSSSLSDYSNISYTVDGGIRIFFDTPVGSVGNNPILNFNVNNLNDNGNIPVVGYEIFYDNNVRSNLGYIQDYGAQGKKGKHFGLDSWGYSYGVNFSSDSSQISWDSFSFSSIGSNCLKSSLDLGLATVDHLVSSNCMNLGILVLKNNGYDYNAGGQGKYLLLSKNPESVSGLLYEVLDCNSYDNIDWLPNLMDSNKCVSLQHGTIDGVLPFTDSGTSISVSSLNGFFGSIFNSSLLYGFASFDDYGLTFVDYRYGDCQDGGYWHDCWGPTHDFQKLSFNSSTSAPSIKEIYISNGGQVGPGGGGNGSITNVNSNSLYYNCLGPIYNTPDGLPPKYCFNSSGEFQGDFLKNCYISIDGNDKYIYCYNDGFQQQVDLIENGSGYDIVACDGCSTNILDSLDIGYSTGYFENFLNTTGYFFKCPFPYSESLTVWPKLISMMNGFDINLPINCAFAGFAQGKQVFTFEHSGHLIPGGPLLNFVGDNRKLLYTFFDILIILGLLFFFGKILKFFS